MLHERHGQRGEDARAAEVDGGRHEGVLALLQVFADDEFSGAAVVETQLAGDVRHDEIDGDAGVPAADVEARVRNAVGIGADDLDVIVGLVAFAVRDFFVRQPGVVRIDSARAQLVAQIAHDHARDGAFRVLVLLGHPQHADARRVGCDRRLRLRIERKRRACNEEQRRGEENPFHVM